MDECQIRSSQHAQGEGKALKFTIDQCWRYEHRDNQNHRDFPGEEVKENRRSLMWWPTWLEWSKPEKDKVPVLQKRPIIPVQPLSVTKMKH